jgi:nucleoside-diphosphate-sugar epimerase
VKILLTGATGFLGFRTLERLSANPLVEKLVATGRTIKPTHFIVHSKVDYQLGDLTNLDFVRQLVSQADCIIHAAALSSPWGRYNDFELANVQTQKNLILAAREFAVNRFVYISSPSIYFNASDRLNIKETDPLPEKFINAYAETKWLAEKELMQSDLPYIILRPRALIGRGDTVIMPRLIHAFREGKLKIIGNGRNLVDLTSVANMAQAIERSMVADEAGLNQSYNITNGEPVRLWDSIDQVLSLLGYRFAQKKVPYTVVNLVARWMEWKSKMTNFKEPVLTIYGVGTLARSFTMDITKARTLLHYKPEVTTQEAMKEFADWYVDTL